jgi:hypothetical protein
MTESNTFCPETSGKCPYYSMCGIKNRIGGFLSCPCYRCIVRVRCSAICIERDYYYSSKYKKVEILKSF